MGTPRRYGCGRGAIAALGVALALAPAGSGQTALPGERAALGERVTQRMIELELSRREARRHGLRIFCTSFNALDGLGDGRVNPGDPTSPGGRPTLGDNGTFLRMNGLDSQSCIECHAVLSQAAIPPTFAVGGVGGAAANAMPGIVDPDVDDTEGNGFAAIRGRFINPPFSFGSGGVELLGKEMTADLQAQKAAAIAAPGTVVRLSTKGVDFGTIRFVDGFLDTSAVVGIDDELVVRPFGRKGCCATIREFDVGAMQFHHGIQPVEVVGEGVDADEDGVVDELTVGELSALHIFQTSLERPSQRGGGAAATRGRQTFVAVGCAECHVPSMFTDSRTLKLSFPEVATRPDANVYFRFDLTRPPARFARAGGGIEVELYADLKRHDMGPDLAESTGDPLDAFFTTARLWGVADTAPYLHDGRATTLTQAILWHGGEAEDSRDAFAELSAAERNDVLAFLRSLRTPRNPNRDIAR